MEWTRVSDTRIVAEGTNPRTAGRLFRKAGFHCARVYFDGAQQSAVEIAAKGLSLTEIENCITTKPDDKPTYKQLTEVVEKLNYLVTSLQDELRQLRQYQANNGIGDRAKKALVNANRTLDIYGGD